MTNNITFILASNTGASIKKFSISKTKIGLCTAFFIGMSILAGAVLYDYYFLKKTALNIVQLEQKISLQTKDIHDQRKQIQLYAREINQLKSKLVDLNNFEQKIRIIANIENTVEQNSIFGIGGSAPEDLDFNIALEKNHSSLLREMHEQISQFQSISVKQKNGFESLLNYLKDQKNLLASTPAISPTKGWVTSHFGYRKSPFTGLKEFHKGLDIAAKTGTPVIATADGIVTFSSKKGLLGNTVVIDHGHGMVTRYSHLEKFSTKRGAVVKRGDVIAYVGNTGRSTGPHLHYSIKLHGISVNPEKYILN